MYAHHSSPHSKSFSVLAQLSACTCIQATSPPTRTYSVYPPPNPPLPQASCVQVRAEGREQALKEMEAMREGLSARLRDTEVALKTASPSVASAASTDESPEMIIEVDKNTYWAEVRAAPADVVVVVDHFTTNCGPCK